jgi:hypothetical protein
VIRVRGLSVVVHIAVVEVQIPGVRRAVLGRLANLCCIILFLTINDGTQPIYYGKIALPVGLNFPVPAAL